MVKLQLFLVFLTALSGCATAQYPQAHQRSVGTDFHTFSYTADLRATHVIKRGDHYMVLSEPFPDAAFSYNQNEGLNFSLVNIGSEKTNEELANESVDLPLTGRAPYVLLARELCYRVSEMCVNTNASYDQYKAALNDALRTLENIAKVEASHVTYNAQVSVATGANASEAQTVTRSRSTTRTSTSTVNENDNLDFSQKPLADSAGSASDSQGGSTESTPEVSEDGGNPEEESQNEGEGGNEDEE